MRVIKDFLWSKVFDGIVVLICMGATAMIAGLKLVIPGLTSEQYYVIVVGICLVVGALVFAIIVLIKAIIARWMGRETPNIKDKREVTYYESRDKAPDLIKELKDDEKAWVLWHVGGKVETDKTDKSFKSQESKIQKMILIHPNSEYLSGLADITLSEKNKLHTRLGWLIDKMTSLRSYPGEDNIHLYRGLPGTLITLSNPERNDAKALVQVVIPHEEATIRPCILVEKTKNEPLYQRISYYFDLVWKESKKPEDDPIVALKTLAAPEPSTASQVDTNRKEPNRKFSGLSDQEIEDTIRKWISVPPFSIQWSPPEPQVFFFSFIINANDNRPLTIMRTREQPGQIALISMGTLSPEQRTIYDSLTINEKKNMLDDISAEMARFGMSNEGINLPLERIVLMETISLDNLQGEVFLRERVQRIRRAIVLVQTHISKHLRGKGNAKTRNN